MKKKIGWSDLDEVAIAVGGVQKLKVDTNGIAGTLTTAGQGDITDVGLLNGLNVNDNFRIVTSSAPVSNTSTGSAGQITWDATYIYVCTATDTWKRIALAADTWP